MMKPILFNTEMVQAILEGRKTATRRIVKRLSEYLSSQSYLIIERNPDERLTFKTEAIPSGLKEIQHIKPKYKIGEVLYVRETFCYDDFDNGGETIYYKADYTDTQAKELFTDIGLNWHPSIHMPKEAARIFLKVSDIRVERLQDITEEQAIKEGIQFFNTKPDETYGITKKEVWFESPIYCFKHLWNSTIKKKDIKKYGWGTNPFCWVIEFERIIEGSEEQPC